MQKLADALSLAHWRATWQSLGIASSHPLDALHAELLAAYSEPHRHYHSLQHLNECFAHWAGVRDQAEEPGLVELALWFHDAIYALRAHDNEACSAHWGGQSALENGLDPASAQRIHALVMATAHAAEPQDNDARLLVDVDLSILGAAQPRFDKYEAQIRQEYAWVPESDFVAGRRRVLEGFLARPRIFSHPRMFDRLESQARSNLARSIHALNLAAS